MERHQFKMAVNKVSYDEERMSEEYFKIKKKLLIGMLFVRMFISGAEYSVILPTALLYMDRFNKTRILMGMVVALYPLGAIVSLPIFGYMYDKTKRIKELLIVLNLFQIIGNIVYSLHFSVWCPLAGRFIGGLGDGFNACAAGELTQLYSSNTRLAILSFLEIGRVLGLMIGPSLNAVIGRNSFIIYTWVLDKTTLPGVAMACIWFIYELLTLCCVYNIGKEQEYYCNLLKREDEQRKNVETQTPVKQENLIYTDDFDEPENESDKSSLTGLLSDSAIEPEDNYDDENEEPQKTNLSRSYWFNTTKAISSTEFLVIFFAELVLWMIQTQFELLLPYITEFNYHWSPAAASLVYVGGSCIILIVFLIIIYLSKKIAIQELYLVLLALILTSISTGLVVFESMTKQLVLRVTTFFVTSSLMFVALPFNLVSTKNLTMKMFPAENQGIIQGFFSVSSRIAMIGGPISMSFVLEKRQYYGIGASATCLFAILALSCSIRRIKKLIQQNELKNDA